MFAHENNTPLERPELVAITENLRKIKKPLGNTDVIESCTRERANRKKVFLKLMNVTTFGSIAQRGSHRLQRHCIARSTLEKSFRQVFNL